MLLAFAALGAVVATASAQSQTLYGQCGGSGYTGPTVCAAGATCSTQGPYYAQCTPATTTLATTKAASTTPAGTAAPTSSQSLYGQCGGNTWTGPTVCTAGATCSTQNSYYAQCTPATTTLATTTKPATTTPKPTTTTTPATTPKPTTTTPNSSQSLYGQCGGSGWTGPTVCAAGASCSTQNSYYAQCTPSSGGATTTTTPAKTTGTTTTTTPPTKPTTTGTSPSSSVLRFAGVNIAGCDFGMDTTGTSDGPSDCPSSVGPSQMQHFTSVDSFNIFRLPVGWQYLVNNVLGGPLYQSFFSTYDALVQSCLSYNAYCIIDIHNYARWNNQIIGQSNGAVTNAQFNSLWSQLASYYAKDSNVIFGLMNEPHDLNMGLWSQTVQSVVSTIRAAGATSQLILVPGTDYTSAGDFATASAPYLANVTDYDGTTSKLIYDVHRYYDSDGSGQSPDCVQNHISDSFSPLATYLRSNGRQALLSETGGGNTASCEEYVCQALAYLEQNTDVYLGYAGWAAGSFATSYPLSEVPVNGQDQALVSTCLAKYL